MSKSREIGKAAIKSTFFFLQKPYRKKITIQGICFGGFQNGMLHKRAQILKGVDNRILISIRLSLFAIDSIDDNARFYCVVIGLFLTKFCFLCLTSTLSCFTKVKLSFPR